MTDRLSDDTASFKVDDAFQITNRNFYLLGFIMSGRVKIGMSVNLTNLGLYKKAVIKDIGLTRPPVKWMSDKKEKLIFNLLCVQKN